MKYISKYLSLSLLLSVTGLVGSCCGVQSPAIGAGCCAPIRTTWAPMTVGQNIYTQYHKLLFPEGFEESEIYNDCDACSWATDFSATYRFQQTRNSCQMAQALWGSNSLIFQGAEVQNRSNAGLVAEYFGMGPNTDGEMTFCPRLRNQIIDFQLAVSGSKFWVQVNVPVTYAKWTVNKSCQPPVMQGTYGTNNLDGDTVDLSYTSTAVGGPVKVSIAGTTMTPTAGNTLLYAGDGTAAANASFTAAIDAANFSNVDTTANITSQSVSMNGAAAANQNVGSATMGLYGQFDAGGLAAMSGSNVATFSTTAVPAAESAGIALAGKTFGMVTNRNFNNFNFNPCGLWRIADIPVMIGYDFCKSDASHIGAYLKLVFPTGNRIDKCFIKNVLSPLVGNGHHFELGIGLTAHANVWVCDTSSFSVYGDGYIDYMFGTCQTRTFDLIGQPMSRYALVYPLTGDQAAGYEITPNTMQVVGDLNIYQGNVTATRGELMLDFVWACRNFEVGLGYAFAGQSKENINCSSCVSPNGVLPVALVGWAYQQEFGVGPTSSTDSTTATFSVAPYDPAANPIAPASNFYYLGATGNAAKVVVADGENAATSYGSDVAVSDAAFLLPGVEGNCSGLMSGQVLNKLFAHIDYVWRDCAWQPEFGILGSIGFVPAGKPTANYWDLGARIGFAF